MNKLLFGTAGIPISSRGSGTAEGIAAVKKLGLGVMELEFVRSVNITKEKAPEVKKSAEENKIVLTCHAPYYINLNSLERVKLKASIYRILRSARIANLCGAWSVTFHAGFYQKSTKEEAYKRVRNSIKEISEKLKGEGNKIWLRPEIMGRKSQFGRMQEVLRLSNEFEQVMPCVDFAHLHAIEGKNNSYEEFCSILTEIEKKIGKRGLEEMHVHMSGMNYGDKGEKKHLNLKDSDLKYREWLKAMKDFKAKGVAISESPNIEGDALLVQNIYKKI
jgi:deoxyribonuclease-4